MLRCCRRNQGAPSAPIAWRCATIQACSGPSATCHSCAIACLTGCRVRVPAMGCGPGWSCRRGWRHRFCMWCWRHRRWPALLALAARLIAQGTAATQPAAGIGFRRRAARDSAHPIESRTLAWISGPASRLADLFCPGLVAHRQQPQSRGSRPARWGDPALGR